MIQNLLICAIVAVGVVSCGYGSVGNPQYSNYAVNYQQFGFPPHFDYDHGYDRSNRHHRLCKPIKPFDSISSANYESLPKVSYYYQEGIQKVLLACDNINSQVQWLVAGSPNANPTGSTDANKNLAIISVSSNSGIVLTCNRRSRKFEAYNYISQNTVPVNSIKCVSVDEDDIPSEVTSVSGIFLQ
ncbi:unnamed protein product [Caenorhabditis angaria]|uniref:Uncharacterized protein n=1 Tax=Caenorhabditis angaria TaxID=860376 RepID=A0A9P1J0A7_9PELO|nr:unnamed protein product [Caenorhabditis angaria]